MWYATNTGLVTELFKDGTEVYKITFPTSQKTLLNGAMVDGATGATVDSSSGIEDGDIIKIDDQYIEVSGVTDGTNLAFSGGVGKTTMFNTQSVDHADDSKLYLVVDISEHDAISHNWWVYDSDMDMVILSVVADTDPRDNLVEAGEDFVDLVTQYRTDASRYLDSRLDPNLPKNQLKDKSGNFDYMIVRTTALIAASFMIKTKDPASEMATSFMDEADKNIEALNNGGAALSWQNTSDASKGVIRDVSYTSGSVRPVDTRGRWSGTFDLIRVLIVTGGALDVTATYSVWVKDGDKLGNQQGNQVVTAEKINGDYQALANGLQIRFGGNTKTSVATATNEWGIEVTGWAEEVDSSSLKHIKLTRKYQ